MQAACLATLSFVVLGSKVGSVQYLMWLMPFWALYRLRVSWLVAAATNVAIFPYAVSAGKFGYVPTHTFAISLTMIFFVRDVLMAAGTVAWLRAELHEPGSPRRRHALARSSPARSPAQPPTG